jgi:hypothetical protein
VNESQHPEPKHKPEPQVKYLCRAFKKLYRQLPQTFKKQILSETEFKLSAMQNNMIRNAIVHRTKTMEFYSVK